MSIFGLLSLLVFLMVLGGLIALYYSSNLDLGLAKAVFVIQRLLVCSQVLIAIYEFPCYVVDGIVFISMGKEQLAQIMFAIAGLIVLFVTGLMLPKIKWKKHVTPTLPKIIALGAVFICIFAYNELFAGVYSFDSLAEYNETREQYEEYDDRFWPTKYIQHYSALRDQECIALYPFDVTLADGTEVNIYKGETFRVENEDGTYELFYYPFTWKLYEGAEAVSFGGASQPVVSDSDLTVSAADASAAQ